MIKRLFSTTKKFPIIVTNNAWNKMTEIVNKKIIERKIQDIKIIKVNQLDLQIC